MSTFPPKKDYETIIAAAYEGLTVEGIVAKTGFTKGQVSSRLERMKTSVSEIRKLRRKGLSLSAMISVINWSFIEEREKNRARNGAIVAWKRSINKDSVTVLAAEIVKMRNMLKAICRELKLEVPE